MFERIKQYLYRSLCRIYRICRVQTGSFSTSSYYHPNILWERQKEDNKLLLHRILLWDNCEPIDEMIHICSVRKYSPDAVHILWNANQVEALMKTLGYTYYFHYTRRIMKADLSRYFLLYRYGGMYLDFDISMHDQLDTLFTEAELKINHTLPDDYCILFEEYRWKNKKEAVDEEEYPIRLFMEQKYRTEALVRVANYAMICTPGHPFMQKVLEECHRRAGLKPTCDYDVLFITGPDVVSHIYHITDEDFKQANHIILIPLEKHHDFITHHCAGSWRNQ